MNGQKGITIIGFNFHDNEGIIFSEEDRVREKKTINIFLKKIAEFPRLTSTTKRSLFKI